MSTQQPPPSQSAPQLQFVDSADADPRQRQTAPGGHSRQILIHGFQLPPHSPSRHSQPTEQTWALDTPLPSSLSSSSLPATSTAIPFGPSSSFGTSTYRPVVVQQRTSLLSSSFKRQQKEMQEMQLSRASCPSSSTMTSHWPSARSDAVSDENPQKRQSTDENRNIADISTSDEVVFGLSPLGDRQPSTTSLISVSTSNENIQHRNGSSSSLMINHTQQMSTVSRVPSLTGDTEENSIVSTLFKAGPTSSPLGPSSISNNSNLPPAQPSTTGAKIASPTLPPITQARLSQRRHTAALLSKNNSRESLKQLIIQQHQQGQQSQKSSRPSSPLSSVPHHIYGQSMPVSASSYSSLAPSPAVSFLSSIAEATNPLTTVAASGLRSPELRGWDGEHIAQYWIGKRLGVGNFGEVYTAYSCMDGESVAGAPALAVKVMSKTRATICDTMLAQRRSSHRSIVEEDDEEQKRKRKEQEELNILNHRIRREVEIWRELHHPHIAPLLDTIETDKHLFLFTEYYRDGNLLEYINSSGRGGLTEKQAAQLFLQMTDAVHYLHTAVRVVHRDLKPENMLLSADNSTGKLILKLCDFGLCEYYQDDCSTGPTPAADENETSLCAGSLAYCSPEELDPTLLTQLPKSIQNALNALDFRQTLPNPSSDVWSLAVVLYAMLRGRLPFADDYMPRLQLQILAGRYKPLPVAGENSASGGSMAQQFANMNRSSSERTYSTEARDLIDGMLQIRVWDRLNIRQVREHPWLKLHSNDKHVESSK